MDRERCSNTEHWGVKRKEKEANKNGREPPEEGKPEGEVSWKNVFQSRENDPLCQMLLTVG